MDSRNYTDVIIAGKVYTLGGYESEEDLQRIAGYLNGKNSELRKIDGFLRQTPDYQNILMQLNVADDYFKAAEELAEVKETAEAQEKELYALKHQLVTVQMKLEKLRSKMDQIEEASRGNHTDGTNTD